MNADLFEGWLEKVFVPELKNPEKIVLILDNISFHRKNYIYNIADDHGLCVIFLPIYSPDLNPI